MSKSAPRFWPNVGKGAFFLIGIYAIGMSFWCSDAGHGFRRRQLERDHRFHASAKNVESVRASLASAGVAKPERDPRYGAAVQEASAIGDKILAETQSDFKGVDALRWTLIGGAGLLAVYFAGAALIWKLKGGPKLGTPSSETLG